MITLLAAGSMLTAAAQETNDLPMQGRRRTVRPEWLQRRAANAQDRGPGGDYFKGRKHQLVVLASFADNPFLGDEEATLAQWDKILNTEQLDEAPFAGSFHDYFYDQSYGQFDLICDLQFVEVDSCRRYRSTMTHDENSQYLVDDVVASLRQRDIQWDRYDWNGDGYVNQLLIIFAGQGSAYGGMGSSYDAIWPHQSWLSWHLIDLQAGSYREADTVRYQEQDYIIDSYCAVQEIAQDSSYGSFGTLCHEYTHCFGFPDFYGSGSVIGNWDLMDNGNYCGGGFMPVGWSAHEKMLMDWLTPLELTTATTVTGMPALTDEPVAYLIRNDAYPDEFFMLENRQKKGWDSELPGEGLVIFHIDYDPEIWLTGYANTSNVSHYIVVPANNHTFRSYSDGWAYPYGTNNALTDTSTPAAVLWHENISGEKLMSKPITDIAVEDGLVSFSFMASPSGVTTISQDPATHSRKLLMNGQLLIEHNGRIFTITGMPVTDRPAD